MFSFRVFGTPLRRTLDRWHGGRPPVMLRRLKADRLPDLPQPMERASPPPMPPPRRQAYDAVIAAFRGVRKPGAMLEVLQRLRSISLHPEPEEPSGDEAFIAGSAASKERSRPSTSSCATP